MKTEDLKIKWHILYHDSCDNNDTELIIEESMDDFGKFFKDFCEPDWRKIIKIWTDEFEEEHTGYYGKDFSGTWED